MHPSTDDVREGYVPVPGGMVWFRRVGSGQGRPLLVLHGGPGSGSDYLYALAELGTERPVIFYDQLGCGRSETPDDPALWTLDRFVAELRVLRRTLGLRRAHLYGHSWGGWLALEVVLRHGIGGGALVLASTSAGMPQHRRELDRLRAGLPPDAVAALARHEAAGDLDHPDYRAAVLQFYQRHLCRLDEWPDQLVDALAGERDNPAYRALLGRNELAVTGTLAGWDRTGDLAAVTAPTLVTVGRYDEITPACATTLCRGIPGSRLAVFERSAHLPHLEEPAAHRQVVADFLREHDREPSTERTGVAAT